ncbi:TRAP transporter small permease subunit [Methylohalobius crimeensis]|uniref:TRAP transporter small permease subunit n=1 Tax=Methylohalobius crimeensis TaxID=244365 RepID=UPI0003B3F072|nr:TRAP transporter small permease subunit [Methylohalobius crimeensis]
MGIFCAIIAGFVRTVDGLNEWLGRAVAWLALGMVMVTFLVVILRYGFDLGWIALQESVVYMHAVLFLLGAGYTLKHDAHVRVDILYQRMGAKGRAWVDFLGAWLLLVPVCVFIFWSAWDYVAASWAIREASREAGGLPAVFLLKSVILGFAAIFLLQGVAQSGRALLIILDRPLKGERS